MARPATRCPCGSGDTLPACCGRYLTGGGEIAPTAERLMRSRYTAFALGDLEHLQASWHRSTRPIALRDDPTTHWTALAVDAHTGGGLFDQEGTVSFRAFFRVGAGGRRGSGGGQGEEQVLAETSRFVREGGVWFYVEPV